MQWLAIAAEWAWAIIGGPRIWQAMRVLFGVRESYEPLESERSE